MEKKLMGMFENLSKQLEGLEDGEDDEEIDDEAIKEAEKMMQGLFGNMMGGEGSNEAGMLSELFKSMGMGMPPK
jgi:hypothetical protein